MPDTDLTIGGANRLLTSGAEPTHIQLGSVTIARDSWSRRTTVPSAFRTIEISSAVIEAELQMIGVDEDDDAEYTNFACIGVWIGDPILPGSILMSFGSAPAGQTYGPKLPDIDLEISANVVLTASQLGNVTFNRAVILNGNESRFGLMRFANGEEATETQAAQRRADRGLSVRRSWEQIESWFGEKKASAAQSAAGESDDALVTPLGVQNHYDSNLNLPRRVATFQARAGFAGASKNAPAIANVTSITSDGRLGLGAGTALPALAIDPVAAGSRIYTGGVFTDLRLHDAGANQYSAGKELFLLDDFTGFSPQPARATKVGTVISNGDGSGRYDVVIDLWSPFLGSAGEDPIVVTATSNVTLPNVAKVRLVLVSGSGGGGGGGGGGSSADQRASGSWGGNGGNGGDGAATTALGRTSGTGPGGVGGGRGFANGRARFPLAGWPANGLSFAGGGRGGAGGPAGSGFSPGGNGGNGQRGHRSVWQGEVDITPGAVVPVVIGAGRAGGPGGAGSTRAPAGSAGAAGPAGTAGWAIIIPIYS